MALVPLTNNRELLALILADMKQMKRKANVLGALCWRLSHEMGQTSDGIDAEGKPVEWDALSDSEKEARAYEPYALEEATRFFGYIDEMDDEIGAMEEALSEVHRTFPDADIVRAALPGESPTARREERWRGMPIFKVAVEAMKKNGVLPPG